MSSTNAPHPLSQDGYFLSQNNPIANRDQRDLEALAISIYARPEIAEEKQSTIASFLRVTSTIASQPVLDILPAYVDTYAFRSIQIAVNSDANFPRIMRVYTPAAKWMGNNVPESRWGQENADNTYRIIPVDHDGQYVVSGQRQQHPPSHISYMLVADTNTSVTVGLIEQHEMDIAADGSFEITLDKTPSNGRRNHIQITPDALYLFIRDTMGDWNQTPDALRVRRLNPATREPLSIDELTARAVRVMRDGVAPAYYWQRIVLNIPMQSISQPHLTGALGGLLTQLSCGGWTRLGDDEAAIITIDPVDAAYRNVQLYNLWGASLDYRDHLTSLNNSQMTAGPDGRLTFVISSRDPGIANWLDNLGIGEVTVMMRWQGLSATAKEPSVGMTIVKFAELDSALPSGVVRMTREERAGQILARQRSYDRRFLAA